MGIFNLFEKKSVNHKEGIGANSAALYEILGLDGGVLETNYKSLATNAYNKNPMVHRAINLIADSVATIKFEVQDEDGETIAKHPITQLLNKPCNSSGATYFWKMVIINKLVYGQSFIRMLDNTELQMLRTPEVQVIEGAYGQPKELQWSPRNGKHITFPIDQFNPARSEVLQIRCPSLLDEFNGLSPLVSAINEVNMFNNSGKLGAKMMENGRPAGILSYISELGDTARARLQDKMNNAYSANNNGKPIVSDGSDVRWTALSSSLRDLEFNNGRLEAGRAIGVALGVPAPLLSLPQGVGASMSLEESQLQFHESTVMPMMDELCDDLSLWLDNKFGKQGLTVSYDINTITALQPRRQALYKRVNDLTCASNRVKCELLGIEYDPSVDVKPEPNVPPVGGTEETPEAEANAEVRDNPSEDSTGGNG